MSLLEPIVRRKALRGLDPKPISSEVLERLVQAAVLAPSCGNAQPWRFVSVTGPALTEVKEALSEGNYWAHNAAAITAVVTSLDWDMRLDHGRDYAFFDTGMAVMNYQLQAIHEGLAVHPVAGFDAVLAKKALGIPESAVLLVLIVLAHPGSPEGLSEKHKTQEVTTSARRPLEEVYTQDAWKPELLPKPKEKA
ncbi:MAG: nitroreductase [Spirochaetales bacterium]|nr:nitroreductase [Spirochaetales bacterium]